MRETNNVPRGLRNHNPLNVERRDGVIWQGMSKRQRDQRFLTFEHPVFGIRCAAIVLLNYEKRSANTVRKIVETWAPATENDTEAYIEHVCRITAFPHNLPLRLRYSPADLGALIEAMAWHECGVQLPYAPLPRGHGKASYVTMAGIQLAYSGWRPMPAKDIYTCL